MKPLVKLATRLYPSAWRKRYGNEFQALLEDVNPGWRELFNIFGGAIKMQLTTGATYMKLGAGFALAGLLVATVASFMVQKTYVSTAVLRVTNVDDLAKAETKVLSRTSLAQIIQDPALQLYPSERREQPLEDVIESMRRRAIHIVLMNNADQSAPAISISFSYTDKKTAQAVVRVLLERFSRSLVGAKTTQNLEVLDPPSLPQFAASPKRPAMLITGLAGGLLLGLIAAVFVKHTRNSLVFATLGLIGCLIGGAISLLIPNRYISRAVIRVAPYDHTFEQTLSRVKKPGLRIIVIDPYRTPGSAVVALTFEDSDPKRARATVQSTITTLVEGTIAKRVETHAIDPTNLEVLDNATLPFRPAYPNRIMIALLGLCCGFVIATLTLMLQRHRTARPA